MSTHTATRRAFLTGAATVAAAAAAAQAMPMNTLKAQEAAGTDWLGAPQAVSEDQIVETVDCDVLVVGAGLSGACAFAAASQEGVKTLCIEKHFTSRYGGIFHSAIGYQDQIDASCTLDPVEVLRDETMKNGPACDTGHWATWAYKSGEIMDWELDIVKSHGVETFLPFTEYPEGADFKNEPFITIPGSYVTSWDLFLNEHHEATRDEIAALVDTALNAGGEIRYNTSACYLEQAEDGTVKAVVAQGPEGFVRINVAKGVCMCTGDFAGNIDMCRGLLPANIADAVYDCNAYTSYMYPEDLPEAGVRLDTGDGHRMCVWAGASMEDNPVSTMGWPAIAEMGLIPYLGLNSAGYRFCNEANAFMMIGRMAYDQPCAAQKGAHFFKVVDANFAEQTAAMQPICMFGQMGGGLDQETMDMQLKADTLEELAELMDVDPDVLKAEVARYNQMVAQGFDSDFGKPAHYLFPIEQPPFYAVRTFQLFVHTMSGVLCSRNLEVMGGDGPIPGLFAAGNVVGRRFGSIYEASLTGMSNAFAVVHGYLAGKNAAAR